MPLKYLWHFGVSKWERVIERIEDGPPKSFSQVHAKFLRERVERKKRMVPRSKKA